MRRWGISLTSVISRPWAEKCFRKSASEILGGKPLMNILDEAIMMLFFVVYISRSMANGFTVGVERVKSFSELGLFKKGERKKKFLYHILIARGSGPDAGPCTGFSNSPTPPSASKMLLYSVVFLHRPELSDGRNSSEQVKRHYKQYDRAENGRG